MTDHPSALVSVPVEPTEAMLDAARGLIMSLSFGVPNYQTSLSDVARSGYYGELWSHILTDEERAMTGPITKAHRAELIYRAMLAAAPAAPQAAGVGERAEVAAFVEAMSAKATSEVRILDTVVPVQAIRSLLRAALATREEAPAEAGEVREAIVTAIAYLNRDQGTDRLNDTVSALMPKLVRADAILRGVV